MISQRIFRPMGQMLGALALTIAAMATAQPIDPAQQPGTAPAGQQSASMQKLQAMQARMQRLSEQLQTIQRQAMQAHPELEERRADYQQLVMDTMSEQGYEAAAALDRMNQMQLQLSSEELSEAEQQSLRSSLQQESIEFRTAQGEAMENETVRAALLELETDLLDAMVAEDPQTEQLIAQLNETQREFQAMIQSMQPEAGQ